MTIHLGARPWGVEISQQFDSGFGIETATASRGGIWLFKSTGSTIKHAIIKNGVIGIQVDSVETGTEFALTMSNTIIENMSAIGLFSREGSIEAESSLVANCGQTCANLVIGGKYKMYRMTFANYWNFGNRQNPAFYLSNYYFDFENNLQIRPLYESEFVNCIMYGDNANQSDFSEFIVDVFDEGSPEYIFRNCVVDTEQEMELPFFELMSNGNAPNFIAPNMNDFDLTGSLPTYMNGENTGSSSNDIELIPFSGNNEKGCYSIN